LSNSSWVQTSSTQVLPAVNNVVSHGAYNQSELNESHEGSVFDFYYRKNNMNYYEVGGTDFTVTDPDTGLEMTTRAKQAYYWFGVQWKDGQKPYGQYDGGYQDLEKGDKLLRSQQINLPESEKAKLGYVDVSWTKPAIVPDRLFETEVFKPLPNKLISDINALKL